MAHLSAEIVRLRGVPINRAAGEVVADVPPAAPTARPDPSRPKTCRAASASSCQRIPPAKNSPDAASLCPRPHGQAESIRYRPAARLFLRCFPSRRNDAQPSVPYQSGILLRSISMPLLLRVTNKLRNQGIKDVLIGRH